MPCKQPFRFLDLPTEFRSIIYSELLIDKYVIYDRDFDDDGVVTAMYS